MGFKSQNSKSLQERCGGWFTAETSADSARAIANAFSAIESGETKMMIKPQHVAAETTVAIDLIMTNSHRRGT